MKINRYTLELNDMIELVDFTDIYRTYHWDIIKDTFSSAAHGSYFTRVDIVAHQ